jgi:hypothetical protein
MNNVISKASVETTVSPLNIFEAVLPVFGKRKKIVQMINSNKENRAISAERL